jgi:hypothetical protein
MFTQKPQALALCHRYQQAGATEIFKNFELQEEAFQILNHPYSCKFGSSVQIIISQVVQVVRYRLHKPFHLVITEELVEIYTQ